MPKKSTTSTELKDKEESSLLRKNIGEQQQDDNDNLLNFAEVCEEVANDLTRGITQCRKSTIFMRKEQSNLARQRVGLAEMLDLAQRDFEIAVKHTKNLI